MSGRRSVSAEELRTIGSRLRRVREDRNKSLRVIAGLVGMSHSTLQRIENGQRLLRHGVRPGAHLRLVYEPQPQVRRRRVRGALADVVDAATLECPQQGRRIGQELLIQLIDQTVQVATVTTHGYHTIGPVRRHVVIHPRTLILYSGHEHGTSTIRGQRSSRD